MQKNTTSCPALIISAPSSGSGKTTITAALAYYHKMQGKTVHIFKTGPDFIDPMILEQASGHPVYQLDLWMVGEQHSKELLFKAAQEADLILIEGVMGLFDGTPSTADLSQLFNIPILAIIDGSAMAQTFGALAYGLQHYRPNLKLAGVAANKIASKKHGELIKQSLPDSVTWFDYFVRNPEITLPERHLGLLQAQELQNIDEKLTLAANQIANSQFKKLPEIVTFKSPNEHNTKHQYSLKGKVIIVAKDLAFSFLYQANLNLLKELGATLVFTSPLSDKTLPDGDAFYLPGGYPELYAEKLSSNHGFITSLVSFHQQGKPILAECGGMMYLLTKLRDSHNNIFEMANLISGVGKMNEKLVGLGLQSAEISPLLSNSCSQVVNTTVRGHSFHYSSANIELEAVAYTQHHPNKSQGEAVYYSKNILASYMHWYFPSNPEFFVKFFKQTL